MPHEVSISSTEVDSLDIFLQNKSFILTSNPSIERKGTRNLKTVFYFEVSSCSSNELIAAVNEYLKAYNFIYKFEDFRDEGEGEYRFDLKNSSIFK